MCAVAGHRTLKRLERPILVLDAGGLALFCVTGASTALDFHVGAIGAIVLGAITGVGGGALRDILLRDVPVVLRSGLYAIPALIGAAIVVVASQIGWHGMAAPIVAAAVCFTIRVLGMHFDLNVPQAPHRQERHPADEQRPRFDT